MPARKDPIKYDATSPANDPSNAAAILFIHGLDDDAFGRLAVPQQNRVSKID